VKGRLHNLRLFSRRHEGEIEIADFDLLGADSVELARLWISAERVNAFVAWKEEWPPELLGSLLVETIYTAAGGVAAHAGISEAEARDRIWRGFDEERERLANGH
jgi:hypothetical protein